MDTKKESTPVTVFAGTILQAEMVRSLLENAEIQSFLKDENVGTMAPWYTSPGGAGPVKVVVSSLDFEMANEIVKEYQENIRS
jgi:hypothetical protein